jgi:probable phosphoglycerate mutase
MNAPFHILLLRHGQTDANAGGVLQGHQPTPLNSLGRRQAGLLAARIGAFVPRPDVLVSSDLPRAAQTAEPIAAALKLPVVTDAAWRERGFGEFEGKTVGEREIWRAAAGDSDPPGAEAVEAFHCRVLSALAGLPGRFPDARCVAVVTHGGPVRTVLRGLVDGVLARANGQAAPELVSIVNCSIMHLVTQRTASNGRAWTLNCVNDAVHLDTLATARDAG